MRQAHLGAQVAAELVQGLSVLLAGPSPAADRRLQDADEIVVGNHIMICTDDDKSHAQDSGSRKAPADE